MSNVLLFLMLCVFGETRRASYINNDDDPACINNTDLCTEWMNKAGSVEMECQFRFRLGLSPDSTKVKHRGPALFLRYGKNFSTTLEPHTEMNTREFELQTTPIICERDRSRQQTENNTLVLLLVASSVEYLFRLWPYFIQKVLWADSIAMRIALWFGELPLGVATSVTEVCSKSQVMTEFLRHQGQIQKAGRSLLVHSYYKKRIDNVTIVNSNHYIKMMATYAILRFSSSSTSAVWYIDMDSIVRNPSYSFGNVSQIKELEAIDTNKKVDVLFFSGSYHPTYYFWQVKGNGYYIRNSIFGRRFIAAWLHWRCVSHDQYALWHTLLSLASREHCVEYNDEIFKLSYHDARSRHQRHLPINIRVNTTECERLCPPEFGYAACSTTRGEIDRRSALPFDHKHLEYSQKYSYFDPTSSTIYNFTVQSMVSSTNTNRGQALLDALSILQLDQNSIQ